jgi:hypothetical protein
LLVTQLDASRALGLVSFDFHQGSPFFLTSETHIVIARLYVLPTPPLALSAEGHSCSNNNTRSLSLLRMSLTQSVCSDVLAGLSCSTPLVVRALRIALNFSPQKAGAAAGWLAACATATGASERRPRSPPRCRHGRDAASDPPPHGRARLIESHHQ